jgi:hypothetical protein
MSQVGFEHTIPVFEWGKIVHISSREAAGIGKTKSHKGMKCTTRTKGRLQTEAELVNEI